jgi:CheY-like chemotaxis protein
MSAKRVLSVGQCQPDHGRLCHILQQLFGAEVVAADDAAEAKRRLAEEIFDLVLVNRVFDSDGASGIQFIREMKQEPGSTPVMLVSNHEEIQREAVSAGAVPGFGKAALGDSAMVERLRGILGNGSDTA